MVTVSGIWWWAKRPPVTSRDKVGFVVGVDTSDSESAIKLREDFIVPLRQLIYSGRGGARFQFIELPQHISQRILDIAAAQELQIRTKAHFIIYGRVRVREIDGKKHNVINLDGFVTHQPIAVDSVQKQFQQEFNELFPRKLRLEKENDLLLFEFTSEWAAIVARYIIAIAATVSGDFEYAEQLFSDVRDQLKGRPAGFPVYQKLLQRVPVRLTEIYEARAMMLFRCWLDSPSNEFVSLMGQQLSKVESEMRGRQSYLGLLVIHKFLEQRDVAASLKTMRQIKTRDAVWHLNLAFLECYQGNLAACSRNYENASRQPISADVMAQVEEFICRILELEPSKYQLHFALGQFNRLAKGDYELAVKDFNKFLECCDTTEFAREQELIPGWIARMQCGELATADSS